MFLCHLQAPSSQLFLPITSVSKCLLKYWFCYLIIIWLWISIISFSYPLCKLSQKPPELIWDSRCCKTNHCDFPSAESNTVFPVGENTSDTDNVLLCPTCVKGQLWTTDSPDVAQSSCEERSYLRAVTLIWSFSVNTLQTFLFARWVQSAEPDDSSELGELSIFPGVGPSHSSHCFCLSVCRWDPALSYSTLVNMNHGDKSSCVPVLFFFLLWHTANLPICT